MADEQKEVLLAELKSKAKKLKKLLPINYQVFAEEYIKDYNGSRSAIAAGFAESGAGVAATRVLKNANAMAYIDAMSRILMHERGVTLEQQLWRMQAISEADITNYVMLVVDEVKVKGKREPLLVERLMFKPFSELTPQQTYAIESIKQGKNGIELKLHGKQWSLDMINKHLGTYERDNKQKGEGLAQGVAVLLPDNRRGRVVANETQ